MLPFSAGRLRYCESLAVQRTRRGGMYAPLFQAGTGKLTTVLSKGAMATGN